MRDLTVIDCSVNHLKNPFFYDIDEGFYEPSDKEKEESVWAYIDSAFSEPVVPNENESHYVPTQIIGELFKSNGADGVVYKSMLGKGYNICLFDIGSVELRSCHLFEANKIEFGFREITNPYYVRHDEE